jgi:hypothetical protein
MSDCGILFPGHNLDRKIVGVNEACPLPVGHDGPHRAGLYLWHTDLDCDCADCRSDEPADWCVVYWKDTEK